MVSHCTSESNCQWHNATKARRKLRIECELKEKARKRANEHWRFEADRYKFVKELFDPPNSAQSTFGVDQAFTHFVETTTDKQRSTVLQPMPGWKTPNAPQHPFFGIGTIIGPTSSCSCLEEE